ncbi:MAG: hypothetical protein AAFV95_09040 [Bacteroidota bacterium]
MTDASSFDSVVHQKVFPLLADGETTNLVLSQGVKYVYRFENAQDLYSEFSIDDLFLPFYLGMMDEAALFQILESLTAENWERAIADLQHFAIPNLKDKHRLIRLASQHIRDERYRQQMESLIFATQFHLDKKRLREQIEKVMRMDPQSFYTGERMKRNILGNMAHRYAYEQIDSFALELVDVLFAEQASTSGQGQIASYHQRDFAPDPLHAFLYFEPQPCNNLLNHINDHGDDQARKKVSRHLSKQKDRCLASEEKLAEVEQLIQSAHLAGILNFDLRPSDKLFLANQKESYGGTTPLLKLVSHSKLGTPFSELNESLRPAVEMTAYMYPKLLKEYIHSTSIFAYDGKKYLLAMDQSKKTWCFDISRFEHVNGPDNSFTDVFNFLLSQQKTISRLVPLERDGFECLLLADPKKTRTFAAENGIELLMEW